MFNSVQNQPNFTIANTRMPNSVSGGSQAIIAFDLDTGSISQGPIENTKEIWYVGVISNGPPKNDFTLKFSSSIDTIRNDGISNPYITKGTMPPDGRGNMNVFLEKHRPRLLELKGYICQLAGSTPPQQQQSGMFNQQPNQQPMNTMQMPPSTQASQFAGSTGQTPSLGFGIGLSHGPQNNSNSLGGMFGQQQPPNSMQNQNQMGNMSGSQQPPVNGGMFGQQQPPNPMQNQNQMGNMSGSQQPPFNGGMFGQQQPPNPMNSQPGMFGSVPNPMQNQNQMGGSQQPPFNGGIFNNQPSPNPMNSQPGMFGSVPNPMQNQNQMVNNGGNIFGGINGAPMGMNQGMQMGMNQGMQMGMNQGMQMGMQQNMPPETIFYNLWSDNKTGLTENKKNEMVKAFLRASSKYIDNGNGVRVRGAKLNAKTPSLVENNLKGTNATVIIIGFRELPRSIDEIDRMISDHQNSGTENDVGIKYRFGVASTGLKNITEPQIGVKDIRDSVKALMKIIITTLAPGGGRINDELFNSLTMQHMQYGMQNQNPLMGGMGMQNQNPLMGMQNQNPLMGGMGMQNQNPLMGMQNQNPLMGGMGMQNQYTPMAPHPYGQQPNTGFNHTAQPMQQLGHAPQQSTAVITKPPNKKNDINTFYNDLQTFEKFSIEIKGLNCVIVKVVDGDTADIGVSIPIKSLHNCRSYTAGGKERSGPVCQINGNHETDDDMISLMRVRFLNVDAAEYHFIYEHEGVKKQHTTFEGWFATELVKKLALTLHEQDARVKIDLHGMDAHARYLGSCTVGGKDIGQALSEMTYNNNGKINPIAVWNHNGNVKSNFTDQFDKFPFKETTENIENKNAMDKAVEEAWPKFISLFGNYEKGVSNQAPQQQPPQQQPPQQQNMFGGPQQAPQQQNNMFGGPQQQPQQQNNMFGGPQQSPQQNMFGGSQQQPPQQQNMFGGSQQPPQQNNMFGGPQQAPQQQNMFGGPQQQASFLPFGQAPQQNILGGQVQPMLNHVQRSHNDDADSDNDPEANDDIEGLADKTADLSFGYEGGDHNSDYDSGNENEGGILDGFK
jgi:endonuclease YncB( thermonuclease family)